LKWHKPLLLKANPLKLHFEQSWTDNYALRSNYANKEINLFVLTLIASQHQVFKYAIIEVFSLIFECGIRVEVFLWKEITHAHGAPMRASRSALRRTSWHRQLIDCA
jgi:hypothetical protein